MKGMGEGTTIGKQGWGLCGRRQGVQKIVKMAGLTLLSLERAACKTGPYLPSGISGGFPTFLDKNGSLDPN